MEKFENKLKREVLNFNSAQFAATARCPAKLLQDYHKFENTKSLYADIQSYKFKANNLPISNDKWRKMQARIIVIYCGLLLTLVAFSIDILLPAFPQIAQDLNSSISKVQLTVPIFVGAIGLGQLINGSLSDWLGRRFVIKSGLCIYIMGGAGVYFSPNIETMLVFNMVQGLGASAGPVAARAIIRDLYSGKQLASNIALAMAVFAIGPIVAPLTGAGFILIFSWRILVILMIILGALLLVFCWFFLPETIKQRNPDAVQLTTIIGNFIKIFTHPQSRFFLFLSGFVMATIMLILINIQAIYLKNFNISGIWFAGHFAIQGFGIVIGQMINREMIARIGVERTAIVGNGVMAATWIIVVCLALLGLLNAWALTFLLVAIAICYQLVFANTAALILDPHGDIAGFTSSFFGFFSQIVSSIIGAILAIFIQGDLLVWAIFLLVISLITFIPQYLWGLVHNIE